MGLTVNDLTDIVAGFLLDDKKPGISSQNKASRPIGKRVFLSDYDIRKRMFPGGKILRVPRDTIISPLSLDWIEFNGVEVVYEQ